MTRLVNSTHLNRVTTPLVRFHHLLRLRQQHLHRSLSNQPLPAHFSLRRRFPNTLLATLKHSSTASYSSSRRQSRPLRTVMDSNPPTEPIAVNVDGEGEDFVRVDNPVVDSLSESMVRVEHPNSAPESESHESNAAEAEQSKDLPEELSRSVLRLICNSTAEGGFCDVYLVGTAHVSQESCREVQAVISHLKPQVVFLELCSSRVTVLTPQNLKVPTMAEMIDMWKKNHNSFGILYSWFLAKVASKLEVFPGSEFRVAFEEAMKYGGRVILGDRPVQITLKRTWAKMPLWHKVKLLYSLLFQAVFLPSPQDLNKMLKAMDDVDMLTLVIQEMSKKFPTLMETLVHERDKYMSYTLLGVARESNSVVAVVGKGHLQGIKNHWMKSVEMSDLVEIPSKKPAFSALGILASFGVAITGVAIVSGIYLTLKK